MPHPVVKCPVCHGLLDEEDLFCSNCGRSTPAPTTPARAPADEHNEEHTHGSHARSAHDYSAHQHGVSIPRIESTTPTLHFSCAGCGASMSYDASAGSLRCPFCGSEQLKSEPPDVKTLKAHRAIEMGVERDQAAELLRGWLGRGFWRPTRLVTDAVITKMAPVYAPYWSFAATTFTYWTADVVTSWGMRGDWRPVTGEHQGRYRDILIGASSVLSQQEMHDICPYDLRAAVPVDQVDLEHATVEQFTVSRKYARPLARQSIEEQEERTCAGTYLNVRFRNLRVNVRIEEMSSEPLLLPIWIAAYRYRGEIYRTLINGQTGRIVGQAPFSWAKLALAVTVAVALAVAFALAMALPEVRGW